jgi:hypothetical protein
MVCTTVGAENEVSATQEGTGFIKVREAAIGEDNDAIQNKTILAAKDG